MKETDVQNTIRIEAAKHGLWLMRNNVGVLLDHKGRPVRFGLMNDSKAVNERCKSSDLIGINGKTGQFIAIECKGPDWRWRGGGREAAQKRFIDAVLARGGLAGFARSWDDVKKIALL
jgi:hypothetical protein